jgi:hypothetical protein
MQILFSGWQRSLRTGKSRLKAFKIQNCMNFQKIKLKIFLPLATGALKIRVAVLNIIHKELMKTLKAL